MLALPKSTEFNKRIPKQKLYEKLTVSQTLKRVFVDQIRVIYWRNKIAPTTVNISAGEKVMELEVFEVQLNQPALDEAVLRQIDKEIPYHILFMLTYEDKAQAWIGFKEAAASGTTAFKVNRYYHTDWLPISEISLPMTGLNMDTVYEGFVRQIAGSLLQTAPAGTLKDSVEKAEQKAALEKQIAALQGKIRKEKQLNRQVEMNGELKRMKKYLELLSE
jgi:hypothetical protein